MPGILEVQGPPIPIYENSLIYYSFEELFPPKVLTDISNIALHAARTVAPDIRGEDIWVSGFSNDYTTEDLARVDATKLSHRFHNDKSSFRFRNGTLVNSEGDLPVYFATPFNYIQDTLASKNPLSYIGDARQGGRLGLYDSRTLKTDPNVYVTQNSNELVQLAGLGSHIMRHALAVVRPQFVEPPPSDAMARLLDLF